MERATTYSGIRFEPGIHPLTTQKFDQLTAAFNSGNLNAHVWNREVGQRIRSSTPSLLVIAIDSVTPNSSPPEIWQWLPMRPARLNAKSRRIHVICGDMVNASEALGRVHPPHFFDDSDKFTTGREILYDANRIVLKQEDVEANKLRLAGGIVSVGGIGGGLLAFIKAGKLDQTEITRKTLLHTTGSLGLAMGGGSLVELASPKVAAITTSEPIKELLDSFMTHPNVLLQNEISVNARTALLIDKEQDAIDMLQLNRSTAGAVVMGYTHGYQADVLLNSKSERKQIIQEFARELLRNVDQFTGQTNLTKQDILFIKTSLLDYMATVQVYTVTDPGVNNSPQVTHAIGHYFQDVARFKSPQVEEALQPLR